MPIPKPRENEEQSVFISRCMHAIGSEFESNDQALAVCHSTWREHKPKKMATKHQELGKLIRQRGDAGQGILKRQGSRYLECWGEHLCGIESYDRKDFGDFLPEGVKPLKNTLMMLKPVITTPSVDRDQDRLRTSGAVVAKRNPLLWQHVWMHPIGKRVATLEHTDKVLKFATALLDLGPLTEDAAKLIEADVLSISHGFRALEWDVLKDEKGEEVGGFDVTKFEIMEHSLVSVPANTDALIESFSRGRLESEEAKRWAKEKYDARSKIYKLGAIEVEVKLAEPATKPSAVKSEPVKDPVPEPAKEPAQETTSRSVDGEKPTEVVPENKAEDTKQVTPETPAEKVTPDAYMLSYLRAADLDELRRGAKLLADLVAQAEAEQLESELATALGFELAAA